MRTIATFFLLLPTVIAEAEVPRPIFYLPLDGNTTAALAGGSPFARSATGRGPVLMIVETQRDKFSRGKVGQCYEVGDSPLVFSCNGNFRLDEGSCSFWMCPQFSGDDTKLYCTFFGAADWGMLYKYAAQTSLTFGTARPEGDLYYDCGSGVLRQWRLGQWVHVMLTWSRQQNARRTYVDGQHVAESPFPSYRKTDDGWMFVGFGCTLYPDYVAHARIDEVAVWDHPLSEDAVGQVYRLGAQGRPLLDVTTTAASENPRWEYSMR